MTADPISGIVYPTRSIAPNVTATMKPTIDAIGAKFGAIPSGLCSLRKVAGQSIPGSAATAVTWDTVISDAGAMHTGSASIITVPTTGVYDITGQVALPPFTSGIAYCTVVAGDVNYLCDGVGALGGAYGVQVPFTAHGVLLTAGQTVSVSLMQTSGGALSIGANSYDNRISARRVA